MTNPATVVKVLDVLENHLPSIDDEFDRINWGGCGLMAQIIAEQLEVLGVPYTVICKGWGENYTNQEVNSLIDNNSTYNMPNNHILIEVEGRWFDSEGGEDSDESRLQAIIDLDTITRMNKLLDCWNKTFDRSQVEDMRVYTDKVFGRAFANHIA
jgi:hypothetical protein